MGKIDKSNMTMKEIMATFNQTEEALMVMDEVEFRARFRERMHHTCEIQMYSAAYRGNTLPASQTDTINKHLSIWEARGLSRDLPEYVTAKLLLKYAETLQAGKHVNLSEYAPSVISEYDLDAFRRIIYERRSVREWDLSREVPDELIDKILDMGLWGAHACNLQSIRYIVIRGQNDGGLFRGSDIPGGPVHILILQDMRVYRANPAMPDVNQPLDCGAAGQNIVLAAHAYGLGGCWLTFMGGEEMKTRIRKQVDEWLTAQGKEPLHEEIELITYVDVGWPDQTPFPPYRQSLDEAVLGRF